MPLMLVTGHIRWRCVDLSSMPKSRSWNIKVHTQLERRNGWVVIAFANSAEVLGLKTQFKYSFLKFSLLTHAEVNGYPTLFRAGEGRDSEKEDWNSTSVIPLPCWLSTSHFPMDTLHLFTQLIRIQGSNSSGDWCLQFPLYFHDSSKRLHYHLVPDPRILRRSPFAL